MKFKDTHPVLVSGFRWWNEIPKMFSKSKQLFRLALIFPPDFSHFTPGGIAPTTKWNDACDDYLRLLRMLLDQGRFASMKIVHDSKKIFSSFTEYERWMRSLDAVDVDYEAPEQVELRSVDGEVLLILTEFWCNCGGPAPYSDSYAFSFYTESSEIHNLCRGLVCDTFHIDSNAIVNERQKMYNKFERFLFRFWRFYAVDDRIQKRVTAEDGDRHD